MHLVMSCNGYSYVHGNPVNLTDPSGEAVPLLALGAIGIKKAFTGAAITVAAYAALQQVHKGVLCAIDPNQAICDVPTPLEMTCNAILDLAFNIPLSDMRHLAPGLQSSPLIHGFPAWYSGTQGQAQTSDLVDAQVQPRERAEDDNVCDPVAFVQWWNSLDPARSGTPGEDWYDYEQRAARTPRELLGDTPRTVPTGPIAADGIDPATCRLIDAKYSDSSFRRFPIPDWYRTTEDYRFLNRELSRYSNAVTTDNGWPGAQPRGVIIRANRSEHVAYWVQMSIEAGLLDVTVEWFP